ncbi:DegT/DnrJ/EryC1/StrS family aminotransferase [Streptomyces nojiriensis]
MNQIPLVDLKAAHAEVADEVRAGFDRVLAGTAFIGGEEVAAFEREYAEFAGVEHCVGVANGTDALELALRASGVGAGDEVVLPANTFIATAGAVARIGARPVLVDCLPDSLLMDPGAAVAAVGEATRAVVPVHLYGQCADTAALAAELPPHVRVVEDAAQSQGATREGRSPAAAGSPRPASTRARTWARTGTRAPWSPTTRRRPPWCGRWPTTAVSPSTGTT